MENQNPSPEHLAKRSVADIEDEIASLSATIAAATYRLLCLVGELLRRDGWADPLDSNGFRSCAHWLSWRVGHSLGVARQYVRVARVLPDLPQISEAFGRGEVSWSKVRAITRVATPDNEWEWLNLARCGTASQVEKLVSKYRRANQAEECDRALEQQRARNLVAYFDHDGMLVLRARLAPEQGALVMKALEVSTDALRDAPDGSAERTAGQANDSSEPLAEPSGDQLKADALVRLAERALDADATGVSDTDKYQVVVHVDAEVLADPAADGRCELEEGPVLAAETVRRLACDSALRAMVHGPAGELTAGRKTRAISTQLRRALLARDGTRCAFPGCGCRGRDGHHVQAWAKGGPTVLENLLLLCKRHHTFVHEGGFRVEALPDGTFRFLRPDGRELEAAPALPAVSGDAGAALLAWISHQVSFDREGPSFPAVFRDRRQYGLYCQGRGRSAGELGTSERAAAGEISRLERWVPPEVRITRDTGYPEWDGEPLDYDWVLGCLAPPRALPDLGRGPVGEGGNPT
jgi:hypothetical protein